MAFIRKHASFLALLAALAGLVAAPYLIPENPDSAIFRSGLFGTLLVMACYMPVKEALQRADRRTLACALGFGLMLGCALSLGSELFVYDGLLPGMGSMIRRLAVPVLAAPLLGGLAARGMLFAPKEGRTLKLPFGAYWVILMLCWLPLLIAFYPGMLNYDLETEYRQFMTGQWDARHPLLYILCTYGIYSLGQIFNQPTLALFLASVVRMACLAAALAYSCVFIQRRRSPVWISVLLIAFYGLLPIFSVMAVSSAKDTPFSAALLVFSLLTWEAIESPIEFFSSKRRCAAFVLTAVLTSHLRKNGIAALVLLPVLFLTLRGFRKQALKLCLTSMGAALLLNVGLNAALQPVAQPSFQLYSLPAQQMVRAYNMGDMTEEEKSELLGFYVDDDWSMRLYPHLADAAKGYIDSDILAKDSDRFMDLWARIGKKNLRLYVEAFLMLNIGSWYPDDLSHTTIYRDAYGLTKGYLQTDEYTLEEYGIRRAYPLPRLSNFVNRICRLNEYQKYPIVTVLLCTATPLWALLFACAQFIAKRQTRFITPASGVMVLWFSYLFGPCTLARYMLPLFCLAPVMLVLAFFSPLSK